MNRIVSLFVAFSMLGNSFPARAQFPPYQANAESAHLVPEFFHEQALVAGLTSWTDSFDIGAKLSIIKRHRVYQQFHYRVVDAPRDERQMIAVLKPNEFVALHLNKNWFIRIVRCIGAHFVYGSINVGPMLVNVWRNAFGFPVFPIFLLEVYFNAQSHRLWNLISPIPLKLPSKEDVLNLLEENHWNIGIVGSKLNKRRNETYDHFFKTYGIEKELKAKAEQFFSESKWEVTKVAERFGVKYKAALRLISNYHLQRPKQSKERMFEILNKYEWNFRDAQKELDFNPKSESFLEFSQRSGIENDLKAKVLDRLNLSNWTIEEVSRYFSISPRSLKSLIRCWRLERSSLSTDEARRVLDSNNWNLLKAKNALGLRSREDYLDAISRFGLLPDLKRKLKQALVSKRWVLSAVYEEFGIDSTTLDGFIEKLKITQPALAKTKSLSILKKYQWNIDLSRKELGLTRNQGIYEFFEQHSLLPELSSKVHESLIRSNGILFRAKDSLGVSLVGMRSIVQRLNLQDVFQDKVSVQPGEIRVSANGLKEVFICIRAKDVKALNRLINASVTDITDVEVGGVIFSRRIHSPYHVWVFHQSQKDSVARLMGWKIRRTTEESIEDLGLESALVLLGDDPLRFKQYVQLYYPELLEEEVDRLVTYGSMHGLRADQYENEDLHEGFKVTLGVPEVVAPDVKRSRTDAHAFKVEGFAGSGVRYVQVTGAYTRRILVRQDGSFGATLPIPKTGESNEFFFYSVKDDSKQRSESTSLVIKQTGTKEDPEAAFLRLLGMKEEILKAITESPARYHFLLHSLEQSLLRQFTYSEKKGFDYLKKRIQAERSPVLKKMLQAVEKEFRDVSTIPLDIKEGQRLYFFQKYTVYMTHKMLNKKDPVTGKVAKGVIIALEQGLGKTVTALVIINGKEAVIVTPNSVVSTWAEQEEKFMNTPRLTHLEGSYKERLLSLWSTVRHQVVTNVEFMQGMTEERAKALSRYARMLVVDEADYLGRLSSQQSQGTRMIKPKNQLLLSATPFKNGANIGNILNFIDPNDPRFKSASAFSKAFRLGDSSSMNALFLLMQRHTIRI